MAEDIYQLEQPDPPPPPRRRGAIGRRDDLPEPVGRILEDRECRKCGYNLRGLRLEGRCPECGEFILPRSTGPSPNPTAAPLQKPTPKPIVVDPVCGFCAYNLNGLPDNARCPECGRSQPPLPKHVDDPLSLMPLGVIKAFRRGCWLATACVAGAIGLFVCSRWLAAPPLLWPVAWLALACLWCLAVWQVTPAFPFRQALQHGFSADSRLRVVTRWLSTGWMLTALRDLLAAKAGAPPLLLQLVNGLGGLGLIAGVVGLVLLAVMLARLAQWARDDTAEKAFTAAAWGLPLMGGLLFLGFQLFGPPNPALNPVFYFHALFFIIWLVLLMALPYGLLSLSASVSYCVRHAREQAEREQRRLERERDHFDQVVREGDP